ncbi:hypothetical protein HRbin36_00818 [bacterium HR36]|nr:hypothetical protein HRbin36_00818 [bacterium HR36]
MLCANSRGQPISKAQSCVIALLLGILVVGSVGYYRLRYAESKRLRTVDPGKLYRSGQLNARGLQRTIQRFGIRTVINLREEAPNPHLAGCSEAHLCQRLGVTYIFLYCDSLSDEQYQAGQWPEAARLFLDIVRRPENQPVLVHCQAGLHRTGVLCAVYRMRAQNWPPEAAWQELRLNGYGEDRCSGISLTFRDYVLPLLAAPRHAIGGHDFSNTRAKPHLNSRPNAHFVPHNYLSHLQEKQSQP